MKFLECQDLWPHLALDRRIYIIWRQWYEGSWCPFEKDVKTRLLSSLVAVFQVPAIVLICFSKDTTFRAAATIGMITQDYVYSSPVFMIHVTSAEAKSSVFPGDVWRLMICGPFSYFTAPLFCAVPPAMLYYLCLIVLGVGELPALPLASATIMALTLMVRELILGMLPVPKSSVSHFIFSNWGDNCGLDLCFKWGHLH